MSTEEKQKTAPKRGPMGRGAGVAEKPKNFKAAFKQLFIYCKPYYGIMLVAIILAIGSAIFTIIGPDKVSDLTNEITKGIMTGIDFEAIKSIAIFLIIIYGLSALFGIIDNLLMARATNDFSYRLRNQIVNKINKLPLKYFDKNSYGDVISRVTNDVDTMGQTLNNSVSSLVNAAVLFVGLIFMMFKTNWIMALTALGSTIIGFVLMMIILANSQKYFTRQQKELGEINGHIEEVYSGYNVVKAYNGEEDAKSKFDEINNRMFNDVRKSQFLSGLMQPIMSFIGNFGYVAVCIVGSALVLNDIITIGDIVAFMIYVRLFSNPLMSIAQSMTQLQSTAAASERVFEFLGEKELASEVDKTVVLNKSEVKGNIEFDNVKFGYNKNKLVIKGFNAKVKAGQKIAIVGPTGAGKTTMVNLLMRFYEINSGDIKIDNISTQELTRENIHDLFTMVLQDTWVFEGTIRENIVYNKEHITDKEVIEACKLVGLDHFIRTLPKGYDTLLTDADSISAGQKQLLTIARGMTHDAPFLILDEATSNVDTRTEELVQEAMDKLSEGKTSFIIAHRLSTIKNADLILVMQEGNIVEQGNHDELLKENGFYAELYNSQFQNIEEA